MKRTLARLRRWWRTRRSPLGALIYEPALDGPKRPLNEPDALPPSLWGTLGLAKTHIIIPSTLTLHYAVAVTYCGRTLGGGLKKGRSLTYSSGQRICKTCRTSLNQVGMDYDPNGYLAEAPGAPA